jgi:hypothetical protein
MHSKSGGGGGSGGRAGVLVDSLNESRIESDDAELEDSEAKRQSCHKLEIWPSINR